MKVSTKAQAAGLVVTGALAGGLLAGTLGASAATTGTTGTSGTTTSPTASSPAPPPAGAPAGGRPGAGPMGPGGAQPMRGDEKLVTGADLATLKAAALKAVPGATIVRIETDSGDATYEAHMTKADGSVVTVKFDKSLAVTSVEDGMGK